VTSQREAREAADVLARVWSMPDGHAPITPEMTWALAHAGNYVSVARLHGEVVGAVVAFRGSDEVGVHLHSHMAGLVEPHQGGSIGFALKLHQRAWALAHGLHRITWTFDPLVARNAYFNVVKLGAVVSRYYADFYGVLSDDLNAGDQSDRCLVTWWLGDERATAAAAGDVQSVDVSALRADGAVVTLDVDAEGGPLRGDGHGPVLLCRMPVDAIALRASAPALARAWRLALRSVLQPALADGFVVAGVTRDSWYVLLRR
jgi:predicted GNAT superfamily acetyltransferase